MSTLYAQLMAFHAHLDACKRCREQPFNLCPDGEKLLTETAKSDRAIAKAEGGG